MDIQLISAIVFLTTILLVVIINRKKLDIEKTPKKWKIPILYTLIYRTKTGLKIMDKIANVSPKFWKIIGWLAIAVGFAGMFFASGIIIHAFWKTVMNFFAPNPIPILNGVSIILPFKVKGAFYVPFWYWLISIFIILVVHEMSHGIMARVYKMKVKSSGLAVFGIILPIVPGAFVEPDEKEVSKKPHSQQLAMFAAGAFANIALAVILLYLVLPYISPPIMNLVNNDGVNVVEVLSERYGPNPAIASGLEMGTKITKIDNFQINTIEDFTNYFLKKRPGDKINIKGTLDGKPVDVNLQIGKQSANPTKAYIGVGVSQSSGIKDSAVQKYGRLIPHLAVWILTLLYWIFLLSFGIGIFNLLPLGPIDGGRMFKIVSQKIFKGNAKHGDILHSAVSLIMLVAIVGGVILSFVG